MERKHFRAHCLNGCGNQLFSTDMIAKYCSPTCADAQCKPFRGLCLNGCGQIVALSRQKYCSLKCQHAYQFRIRSAALEAGTYRAYNCNGFIRKYLISKIGEQCSSCGWHERHPRTGRVPVEVEHIDGNWENNLPENLTLLCPNCHALTETYRGLNRGRGRAHRLGGRKNPLPAEPLTRENKSRLARLPTLTQGQPAATAQLPLLLPT